MLSVTTNNECNNASNDTGDWPTNDDDDNISDDGGSGDDGSLRRKQAKQIARSIVAEWQQRLALEGIMGSPMASCAEARNN